MYTLSLKGMRDPGEVITKTLVREFAEEALDYEVKYDKNDKINTKAGQLEAKLSTFFRNGTQVSFFITNIYCISIH